MCMSDSLRSDEVAIRRDLFNGLVDELTDALGWLLVIQEENPDVLQKACGHLNAEERLAQMSAVLSGKTYDKRYAIAEGIYSNNGEEAAAELTASISEDGNVPHAGDRATDKESWKRAVEEKKDGDGQNTRN